MRVRWLALAALLALSGCESLSYYAQAVGGQLEMMHRAELVVRGRKSLPRGGRL